MGWTKGALEKDSAPGASETAQANISDECPPLPGKVPSACCRLPAAEMQVWVLPDDMAVVSDAAGEMAVVSEAAGEMGTPPL